MSRVHVQGDLRADKIKYPDGVGCSIWYPLTGTEEAGICFDFPACDLLDMIKLLQTLQDSEPDVFVEDKESAAFVAALKE